MAKAELFNFADTRIGTTISSNYPSTTGYEPTNLIHPSAAGFLSESFVRPPVELTLTFPYSLSLAAILINPRIRLYHVKHLAISAQCQSDAWLPLKRLAWDTKSSEVAAVYNPEIGADMCANSIPERHIQQWQPIHLGRASDARMLHAVQCLKIRITGMHNMSVVALGGIKVYGQPSQQMTHGRDAKFTAARRILAPPPALSAAAQPPADRIPPEFIDPITQEAMRDPVVLPSNNVVDRSTIHRHLQLHQTDPFTGLPMSQDDAKPALLLQIRIRDWRQQ
ncbi:RING finger protein 37 [Linderina pennispora]|nr:RING finger protein 37 [Linderina pennispora]